ncbi:hypothetical protein GLOTRDRAFT_125535 [Gloeophyllum trabeum ATCC 11539]|uniref:Uncharacterized protein n=1 Tax=Gloeophyllum trabeum (strain ATCC 11539 / FP-39264 / Madison 617) TaxID=670483 RepID=S7QHE5_GLOTA|nr:uncharacterized protein GLOTRDRAFT_125535 [Gloeophyllum trabeum ATCC 11539]EPQ59226.1 hypothetical protein GLOTRDRAFT_125535 [Gloeophyllum trabeum ATCC 11539]
MTAFSRLQLAAALIEYDNDPSNPNAPFRSAHDSAIFAHLRRNNAPRPGSRKSTDYLGVALPSEAGSVSGRESAMDNRRSRGSMDALRNPFGAAEEEVEPEHEPEHEEDLDIDLASWGLDAFIKKEKAPKKSAAKAKSDVLPNPHPVKLEENSAGPSRRPVPSGSRSMSVSGLDGFGEGGAFLESKSNMRPDMPRRASFGSPLDFPERKTDSPRPTHERAVSHHALIANMPTTPPLHSVPFPSQSTDELNNIPRLPSPDRGSVYYPRGPGAHGRTTSHGTMATMASKALLNDENSPFAVRPPSPSRSSRFDPKAMAHARTMSNASWGTQALLNRDDAVSVAPSGMERNQERRYSKWDLMRPKVLVMPSPLQGTMPMKSGPPPVRSKDGFELSTDGRPLPPGARASRRVSGVLSPIQPSAPIASNSFTPNPRTSLTLSQLTFRNSLMVDGQRDVAYADIESQLPRATEDGQQVALPTPVLEEPEIPLPVVTEPEPESNQPRRPPGKLFGTSLIDNLEARKAEMRSRQRVFTGDERPSMMARGSMHRSSTLIDPASLGRPTSQHMNSFNSEPALQRRNSAGGQPLLSFDDDKKLSPGPALDVRMPKSRSVFGVDTLWEREMAKLKEIEERERAEAEERRKREEAEDAKHSKKRKGKGKAVDAPQGLSPSPSPAEPASPVIRTSASPPRLPDIPSATTRRAPPPVDDDGDDGDSDSDSGSEVGQAPVAQSVRGDNTGWASDEEAGPIRTTGTGPRFRPRKNSRPEIFESKADDSDDEDVPLAATLRLPSQRLTARPPESDSEEDRPLSKLLTKGISTPGGLSPRPSTAANSNGGDDDDDKPLGLRASVLPPSLPPLGLSSMSNKGNDDDDERPLALHPERQRRTQYNMMAQQQQMMMQAQMTGSMFFTPPMMGMGMGSGFFAPSMPQMMMPPMPVTSPPPPAPLHDAAKLNRVDKWRHDVAVEGPE